MYRIFSTSLIFILLLNTVAPFAKAQETITVTAQVPIKASDVEMSISNSPSSTQTVGEGDEITYTISYRLLTSGGSYPFTIEGSWEQGVIEGTTTLVDILDYVVGSAQTSSEGAVPTIDLQNNKITWEISNLTPSATAKTITFKLKVKSNISTDKKITANIKADGTVAGITLPQQQTQTTIQKQSTTVTPTLTPTTTPTKTPTPTPTTTSTSSSSSPTATPTPVSPTSTPTPTVSISTGPTFESVDITEVTDNSVQIEVETSLETFYTIFFGTDPKKLSDKLSGSIFSKKHSITLRNLQPGTKYYFKVQIADRSGKNRTSDMFTFTTASGADTFTLDSSTITISSNKIILSSDKVNTIVVPKGNFINISLKLPNTSHISYISTRFLNERVLGTTTSTAPLLNLKNSTFVETLPGILSAEIQVPEVAAVYELLLEIKTTSGGYYLKKVPYTFYISDPLTVVNQKTKQPIEGATINVLRYEESFKKYTVIKQGLNFSNKTDYRGVLNVILPAGTYLFEVNATGHEAVKKHVGLGLTEFSYPTIEMSSHFSFADIVVYVKESISDLWTAFATYGVNFFSSKRALDSATLSVVLFELSIIMLFLLRRRKHSITFINWLKDISVIFLSVFTVLKAGLFFIFFTVYRGFGSSYILLILAVISITQLVFILREMWERISQGSSISSK